MVGIGRMQRAREGQTLRTFSIEFEAGVPMLKRSGVLRLTSVGEKFSQAEIVESSGEGVYFWDKVLVPSPAAPAR